MRPSEYDPVGYAITKRFIEDGKGHVFKGADFDPGRPVLVLQGAEDRDVPIAHARALATVLAGNHVRITEVADGEHRLSRPQDLDKLYALIDEVLSTSKAERRFLRLARMKRFSPSNLRTAYQFIAASRGIGRRGGDCGARHAPERNEDEVERHRENG